MDLVYQVGKLIVNQFQRIVGSFDLLAILVNMHPCRLVVGLFGLQPEA